MAQKKKTINNPPSVSPSISGNTKNSKQSGNDVIELIKFDKPTKIFLGICGLLFVILVANNINFSSLHCWTNIIPNADKSGLIYGTPKTIRSDEWLGGATNFLSQYHNNLAHQNESYGPGNVETYIGVTRHWTVLFKPAFLGLYFLDVEGGYSFYFVFKLITLLIAGVLFFKLFTKNNFWLSLLGTLALVFSSAVQWWFTVGLPEMIFAYLLVIISLIYLLYSRDIKSLLIATLLLCYSGTSFVLNIYPPYQVPLGYFFLCTVLGFILQTKNYDILNKLKKEKITGIIIVVVFIALMVLLFYLATKDFFDAMANTKYPGARINEVGGNGYTPALFSDFFSLYFTDINMPKTWPNICEASSSIMLFPFLILMYIWYYIRTKKHDFIILFQSLFFIMQTIWILVGFPLIIAKISLMSMSPEYRADTMMAVCNILFIVIFIGRKIEKSSPKTIENIVAIAILFIFVYWATNYTAGTAGDFFSKKQITNTTLLIGLIVSLILLSNKNKYIGIGAMTIMLYMLWPNLKINPTVKGMAPLTNSPMAKAIQQIVKQDPEARWAGMGSIHLPNFLKANGAKVINGLSIAPDIKKFRLLDPSGINDSTYNRNGHFLMYSAITPNDTITFKLVQSDLFYTQLDPCTEKLKSLNVKYVSFAYTPQPAEVRCMQLISTDGFPIYKINNR